MTTTVEQNIDTAYFYTNVQSGDIHYSLYEPEYPEQELYHIKEIPMSAVPQWALSSLVE